MTPEFPRKAWYAIALSSDLSRRARPVPAMIFATPLIVWRTSHGVVVALTDRCPHRGVPLSMGKRCGDDVRCGYHGWRFSGDGTCREIPGLAGEPDRPARHATAWSVRERQGVIWVWGDPGSKPSAEPPVFREASDDRYLVVRRQFVMPGNTFDAIENALDVPHTAFVHAGLFRVNSARRPVRCVVRREADEATCTFVGEKPPSGIISRFLGARKGELTHVDRFRLPSLTEVTYRLDDSVHVVLGGAWAPIDGERTGLIAVVCVRAPVPYPLLRTVLEPIATAILRQDMRWLAAQHRASTDAHDAFASTPIDVLGGPIRRLLADAVRGESTPPSEREVEMWV